MDKLFGGMRKHARAARQTLSPQWAQGTLLEEGNQAASPRLNLKTLASALLVAGLLSACGGGGGGSGSGSPSTNPPGTQGTGQNGGGGNPPPTSASTIMSCVDGPTYQCSGSSVIRTDNGVKMTNSGVQAYGISTSDLATPNMYKTGAFGLALPSEASALGLAEIRLSKDANGTVSSPALLLSNLGLTWDGKTERPLIIDTFRTDQGRSLLNTNGAIAQAPLPPTSDLSFYDYAVRGVNGTQANYANNRYFPRSGNPSRSCPHGSPYYCENETTGFQYQPGNWRTGGANPDSAYAIRLHGDGDVHAGDDQPAADGSRRILAGGTGPGVPFPGSKGYRSMENRSFQYSNLAAWVTQDTVLLHEWGGPDEHNKNRRGTVAFGDVTDPAAVPTSGTATYSGTAYGWYARNGNLAEDPVVFEGAAMMTVNFATRQVTVTIQNTVTYTETSANPVPVAFTSTATMGAASERLSNYLTGPADNGTLRGGVSARYFGPVVATGSSGSAPAEAAGSFSLANATTGQTVIGGFIARKQ